jgi:4-amino-4-deoxy-L-arabinose transferase-like glycosyltransferase
VRGAVAASAPRERALALAAVPAAATIAAVALLLKLVYRPTHLNYDTRYALLWAQDLWSGHTPEYRADFAPTPHPLQTALSSLALPLGDHADRAITWAALLFFGAVVYLVHRLGAELFSPAAGVVAALVALTRPVLERDALLAYQDVAFAALILGAVLLEARRPRRGAPVLGVLAVAGLLRPEAWVLSGLYWLSLWPAAGTHRRRAALAAIVAVAPLLWALSDWLVTGDALHSLHGTAELAEAADRRRRLDQVPYWTAQYFGNVLREPLVLGVPIGLLFAYHHARRRAILPLAVALAMTAVFAIGPIFGLPLIGRYLRTPAMLLALFYGLAVCGWALLPPGKPRRRWLAAGVLAAALSVAFIPKQIDMLQNLHARLSRDGKVYADLHAVAEAPAVRAAFARCAPLSSADHRPIPHLRYWLDGAPGSVGTVRADASPLGRLLLVPRATRLAKGLYKANFPRDVRPPADYRQVYENRSWRLWAAPGCA